MKDAAGRVNLDYYPVIVKKLPMLDGKQLTPVQLLEHVRLHMNSFVDTGISDFHPFQDQDKPVWESDDPDGALVLINIKLAPGVVDYGLVVTSQDVSSEWRFSTVRGGSGFTAINDRNKPGAHPVTGNRAFGFHGAGPWTFYTIGGDRATRSMDEFFGIPRANEIGYGQADKLWKSFQKKLVEFVNSHEGEAEINVSATSSKRYSWDSIKGNRTVFDTSDQPAWAPVPAPN